MTTFALLLAGLVSAEASPRDDAVERELERHQGAWAVVSMEYEGEQTPEEIARSIRRVVEKDHVAWLRDGKSFAGTRIELDPSSDPKAIDVIPDGGPNRGGRVLGIYKLEGDRLTICMAKPGRGRPKEFRAEAGSGYTLTTLRREPSEP